MLLSHIPFPSFTLVLTSDHRSSYDGPVPIIPDHLMKTIDLRYVPNDNNAYFEDNESSADSVDTQTIFELEEPAGNGPIKKFSLLFYKLLSLKRRLTRK